MTEQVPEFDVLHAVRLRGVASTEAIAVSLDVPVEGVQPTIDGLVASGALLFREGRRVSGYVLTEDGKARHASELAAEAEGRQEQLQQVYDQFLTLNGRIKSMCAAWQDIDDDARRLNAIEGLEDFDELAQVVFRRAGAVIPRLSNHGRRLGEALEQLAEGDNRYFTSPLVESYHSVWFEAHEDFLMCLGIDRAAEGSF